MYEIRGVRVEIYLGEMRISLLDVYRALKALRALLVLR